MEFNYKNILELRKIELNKLEEYYKELRKYEYITDKKIEYIELRKKINFIIRIILKIDRILSKRTAKLIDDKSIQTSKPKIYAVTHVGRYDIETAMEVIRENKFLLMSDPGETYRNIDGLMLKLNGVVYFDTKDKEDRHIAKETCIRILNQGGNIMIFPEGAWNITENQLVMKLFSGTVEMVKQTGADIIPVAIEKYDNSYYVNIGKNISADEIILDSNKDISNNLRDILATLKWEIMEKFPTVVREELPNNFGEIFLDSIMSETEIGYTVEEIKRTRFNDRNSIAPEEAFAFLKDININANNAFLFNDNYAKVKKYNNK